MSVIRIRVAAVALCCALAPGISDPARAASPLEAPEFKAMIEAEYTPETTLAFADLAERAGQPDMAIAALERMLRRHPGTDAAHDRLARLYAAVGNQALANRHAATVTTVEAPSTTRVWGRVTAGFAHDSNPTNAESSETIRILDTVNNVFLNVPAQDRAPDTLVTGSVDLGLLHQMSPTVLMAADLAIRAERYSSTDGLDNVAAQVTVGPWLGSGEDGLFLRPYARAGGAILDGAFYYATVGGGAEIRIALSDTLSVRLDLGLQHIDYDGGITSAFPINRLDNLRVQGEAAIYGQTGGGIGYLLQTTMGVSSAKAKPESIVYLGLDASVSTPVAAFERALGTPLTLQIGASADYTRYRAADPVIDPFKARQDLWLGGNGALVLGLTDTIDLTIGADFVRRFSNIAAFDSQNLRLLTRLGYSF